MFSENNLLLLLMCIIPAVLYSMIIYFHAPHGAIKTKASITYLYTGLLSTTILSFVFLLFPNIRQEMFNLYIGKMYINGIMSDVYIRTTETIFMMAFLQVAFIEELCKFASLKLSDYGRGKRKKDIDSHYSIMFYCAIVSASFAIMESLNYAQRTMAGEFGLFITPKEVLFVRSFTSVILHMVCGLFMGYFIALSKGKNFYMKTLYSLIGIIAATIAHGIYDFMLMLVKDQKDMFFLGKNMYVYTPTIMLLLVYVFLAYLASNDLKKKYIESSIY